MQLMYKLTIIRNQTMSDYRSSSDFRGIFCRAWDGTTSKCPSVGMIDPNVHLCQCSSLRKQQFSLALIHQTSANTPWRHDQLTPAISRFQGHCRDIPVISQFITKYSTTELRPSNHVQLFLTHGGFNKWGYPKMDGL